MDRIQDSTRYSFPWPHENQDEYEGGPSGVDRPSSSHTIDPDYLHHSQHDQVGTSFTPHFPSTSGEYFPRNDDYHQFHPVARPRAIPYDPANQWQYNLYPPAGSSHPETRQFPFDEPSASYSQNPQEYDNPTDSYPQPPHHTSVYPHATPGDSSRNRPFASSFSSYPEQQNHSFDESQQEQFPPTAPSQASLFDSSNPWQFDAYVPSSYPEPHQLPSGEKHLPLIVRPEAIPFHSSNQWQYGLYPPAIVPHPETQQLLPGPSEVSLHPETLECPTNETSTLHIQKTQAQRLAPYMEESSKRLKDDLIPFNIFMSSHNKMLMHQFRILPELERDMMRVDDVLKFISLLDDIDPRTRMKSFQKAVKKYQFGSIQTFTRNYVDYCSFESDPNSPNYAHLLQALEIITPLEQAYNLKTSTVGFCRNLHYFTHRPRVSRAVIAGDFGIEHGRVSDMIVQFSRVAKKAKIGFIKFKTLDRRTGKFLEPDGDHKARYYHWKGPHHPQVNINQSLE